MICIGVRARHRRNLDELSDEQDVGRQALYGIDLMGTVLGAARIMESLRLIVEAV